MKILDQVHTYVHWGEGDTPAQSTQASTRFTYFDDWESLPVRFDKALQHPFPDLLAVLSIDKNVNTRPVHNQSTESEARNDPIIPIIYLRRRDGGS